MKEEFNNQLLYSRLHGHAMHYVVGVACEPCMKIERIDVDVVE